MIVTVEEYVDFYVLSSPVSEIAIRTMQNGFYLLGSITPYL